jgi:hypothetical protein
LICRFVLAGLSFFASLALLSGCNEKLPFQPTFTDDTDWIPSIVLSHNDYQRIQIGIEEPTRKELLRNIVSYAVQIRTSGAAEYVSSDTIKGTVIPPRYIFEQPVGWYPYDSRPVLEYGTSYSVRLSINYRTGSSRFSNEIAFTSPPERGKVLRRISIPANVYVDFGTFLLFHNGDLMIIMGSNITKMDTATGQAVLLKNDFHAPYDTPLPWFQSITVCGDTLLTFYANQAFAQYTLVSLNLQTLQVDSSTKVSVPGKHLEGLVYRGTDVYSLWSSNGREEFVVLDRGTGQPLQTLPEFSSVFPPPTTFASDGSSLWFSSIGDYDNRVIRFDPSDAAFIEQQRNPVFQPQGLTWDGNHFWVIDLESRTLVKLELQGL